MDNFRKELKTRTSVRTWSSLCWELALQFLVQANREILIVATADSRSLRNAFVFNLPGGSPCAARVIRISREPEEIQTASHPEQECAMQRQLNWSLLLVIVLSVFTPSQNPATPTRTPPSGLCYVGDIHSSVTTREHLIDDPRALDDCHLAPVSTPDWIVFDRSGRIIESGDSNVERSLPASSFFLRSFRSGSRGSCV